MHTFGKRRDSAAEGTEGANTGKLDGVGQLQRHLLQLALLSSPFVCVEINLRRCEATCLGPHSQNNLGFTHLAQGLLQGETYCSKVSHLPRRCGVGRWFWNPLPFNWRQLDCKSLRCCPGAYKRPLRDAGFPAFTACPGSQPLCAGGVGEGGHLLPPYKRETGVSPPPTPFYLPAFIFTAPPPISAPH